MAVQMVFKSNLGGCLIINTRLHIANYKFTLPGIKLFLSEQPYSCVIYYSLAYTPDEIISIIKQANNLVDDDVRVESM